MSAFDELYYRFFKSAVACWLSGQELKGRPVQEWYGMVPEFWAAEGRAWGRAAMALRPYMSVFHVKQIEGTVYKGQFTLNEAGEVVRNESTSTK